MYVVCMYTSYAILYLLIKVGNTAVDRLPQHKKQPTNKLSTSLVHCPLIKHHSALLTLITTHRQDTNTAQQQQQQQQ